MSDKKQEQQVMSILEDIIELCESGEFEPMVFLNFIGSGRVNGLKKFHDNNFN